MKKTLLLLPLLLIPTTFATFSDVPTTHPYLEAINYAQENNIVNGYKDETFQSENKITREEFTKIIIKPLFFDYQIYWESCFSDVNWWDFENYICTAKREGIIWWYKDGTFKPKDNISFLEAAKIIILALEKQEEIWSEEWLDKYWKYLGNQDAIPTSVVNNEQQINRWEMVEIIWRLKDIIEEKNFYKELLKEIDFVFDSGNRYLKRNNKVYHLWDEMLEADYDTFEIIDSDYAKDKNSVYFRGEIIEWFDVETFEFISRNYVKDKNHCYWKSNIVSMSECE